MTPPARYRTRFPLPTDVIVCIMCANKYTPLGGDMRKMNTGHVRKNLVVSPANIKELQRFLDVESESEAVRIAVEDRLLAERLAAAADRIAKRGGLIDVFKRSAGLRQRGRR